MIASAQTGSATAHATAFTSTLDSLREWMEARDYAGYEPYDLLNSPYLRGSWARKQPFASLIIQSGRRLGGLRLRRLMGVPPSKNPKALGLILAGYCDLARSGHDVENNVQYLKHELQRLRSPYEEHYCWGYDWDFVSLRGTRLQAFSPNAIATCFCASALLEMASTFGDSEAASMAESAGEFLVRRLNRPVESQDQLCFSYTPGDQTCIYNSSVLVGALLARLAKQTQNLEYLSLAKRSMRYLADQQRQDGSWTYGAGRMQKWIDGFHTGYNLCALLGYVQTTGDKSFEEHLETGYLFYKETFFLADGTPKYFHNRLYPIDIHSCSQAILTFTAFRYRDPEALSLAERTASWTVENMRSADGSFFYQRRRLTTDRTPYMRWGQAWMFRALAKLQQVVSNQQADDSAGGSASPDARRFKETI